MPGVAVYYWQKKQECWCSQNVLNDLPVSTDAAAFIKGSKQGVDNGKLFINLPACL